MLVFEKSANILISRWIILAALFLMLWMSNTCFAAIGEVYGDCNKLKLKKATGVPDGSKHHYEFSGTCDLNLETESGPYFLKRIPAYAQADWNAATHTLQEAFAAMAPVNFTHSHKDGNTSYNDVAVHITTGKVQSTFKCTDDPVITEATCGLTAHTNKSNFKNFSFEPEQKSQPIVNRRATLAEATALSKQYANKPKSGTPPPPPPKPQPNANKDKPGKNYAAIKSAITAMLINVEGEEIVNNHKYQVNAGTVTVQGMSSFGSGWSNNRQLFWNGGSVGAVLDILVNIPVASTYAIELYPTRAPDYAQVKVQVDGHDGPVMLENYSPRVMRPTPRQIGKFYIGKGERRISFMIVGKNARSSGYLFGIDRIRLYPAGN
jgi:hypothetical protein